jgi:dolichol-phosphate mannosyltransferase
MGDELGRLSCVQLATVKHTNPSAALTAQGFALIGTVSAAVSGSQGSAANFASICERVAQGCAPSTSRSYVVAMSGRCYATRYGGWVRRRVIIPTYNEADNIVAVMERTRAALPDADILIVDDGSPDGTAEIAEKLGAEIGGVDILRRSGKQGLGSAYIAGFKRSLDDGYDVVVEMDADLSHDPAMLPYIVGPIPDVADLVIGSRYVPGGSIPDWPKRRELLSRWGNRYAALVLGLAINDSTAGYRAYSTNMLRKIDLDHVRADGYAFQIEMTYRVINEGGRVIEVPIKFIDRAVGDSKMSSKIVVEALGLVTLWGIRDRFFTRKVHRRDRER